MLLRLFLGVILCLALVHSSIAQDPCALPPNFSSFWIGSPDAYVKCLKSLPFVQNLALGTLESLEHLITLYSFTDIAKNSGGPYDLHVDLPVSLGAIKSKVLALGYTSDYAFHMDLMNLFNSLNDAHTVYMAPAGYMCGLARPFRPLLSNDANGRHWTFEAGLLSFATDTVWQSVWGVTPSQSFNKNLTAINGMSPNDYFVQYARTTVGNYKDLNVRFNAALRSDWMQSMFARFPYESLSLNNVYKIDGVDVTYQDVVVCPQAPTSTVNMLKMNLVGSPAGSTSAHPAYHRAQRSSQYSASDVRKRLQSLDASKDGTDVLQDQRVWMDSISKPIIAQLASKTAASHKTATKTAAPTVIVSRDQKTRQTHKKKINLIQGRDFTANPQFLEIVASTPTGSASYMRYNDGVNPLIGIVKVTTFMAFDVEQYAQVLTSAMVDLDNRNASNLILDMQGNGGGVICFADALLTLLTPNFNLYPPFGKMPMGMYDFRQSKLTDAIRKTDDLSQVITSSDSFYNATTGAKFPGQSLYNPRLIQRGGSWSNYTQQGLFPAQCSWLSLVLPALNHFVPNILALTDGTCGSACALFLTQIQTHKIGKTVSLGGPEDSQVPLATTSFAGGNVLNYGDIASLATSDTSRALLPPFPTSAVATWNMNEFYPSDDLNTPREFLKRPADFHLDFWASLGLDSVSESNKPMLTTMYTSAMAAAWKMRF